MNKLFSLNSFLFLVLTGIFTIDTGYEVGNKVEDFSLKNVDGTFVSLNDHTENKGYIVVFTCNTCPWARGYEQRIIDLHNKYAKLGYPIIAIQPNDAKQSSGDSYSEMKKRAEVMNYPFPYLQDETQETALAFGATKTPDVFIVEKENDGYYLRYKGTIDDNPRNGSQAKARYVENAVDQLLAGKEIEIKTTKGIGCGIKWNSASKDKLDKS